MSGTLSRFALGLVVLVASAACKHRPPPPPPPPFVPTTITTLPFDNATASVDAPKILRNLLHPRLGRKGYIVQAMPDTDAKLGAMGIQLGGQMKGVDPKELRQKLGADLAVWGTVYTASSLVTGVYNRRTVEAEIVLTDLRTGEVLWKDRQKVVSDEAGDTHTGIGFVGSVVAGVAQGNLAKEHTKLAEVLVNRMPWCPREAPPPPLPPPDATGTAPAPAASPAAAPVATPAPPKPK